MGRNGAARVMETITGEVLAGPVPTLFGAVAEAWEARLRLAVGWGILWAIIVLGAGVYFLLLFKIILAIILLLKKIVKAIRE